MRHVITTQHRPPTLSTSAPFVASKQRVWQQYASMALAPTVLPRILLALLGFVPIGSLCIALFGLVPLYITARFVVLPVAAVVVALGLRHPLIGRLALLGFIAGVAATATYDLVRLAFVLSGRWSDFIPVIGRLALLDEHASPVWGYLWRYIGNGGAMGLTFALLPWRSVRAGLLYGACICGCLFATLILAPGAQQALFHLTLLTGTMALLGHLVYGSALGWLLVRFTQQRIAAA